MVPRVGTQLLAYRIQGRSLTAAIAQDTFDDFAQVGSLANLERILGKVSSNVFDDQRYSINDGILALTVFVAAMEQPFNDLFIVLAKNRRKLQKTELLGRFSADRADRLEGFKMLASHEASAPDHDSRTTRRKDLTDRTGDRRDTARVCGHVVNSRCGHATDQDSP